MANISKQKRDKMLKYLESLKVIHNDDESIKMFNEIEDSLTEKKYGLVFEEHTEQVNELIDINIPVLVEDTEKRVSIDDSFFYNYILEGDNLASLNILKKTHKGKIDVIYIDPPYNTGAKTWRYNNDYVMKDDTFKHSKWLSMMKERILIAKTLLTESGYFICAIDANELFTIGLLLDEIFGEDNRLGLVTVLHNPKGRNFTKWFSANSEYMLVYAKNAQKANFNDVAIDDEIKATFTLQDAGDSRKYRLEPFMRSRTETLRENKPNFWYPLYVSKDLKTITRIKSDEYYEVYPIASNGKEATWINLPETFDEKNELNNFVAKFENERIVIYRKLYEQQVYKNVWIDKKYQSEFNGTNVLKQILGANIFDYPKSIYLMEDILKLTSKKDSIILDFFAGSGTTGHAVLELNKEDNGKRRFILCTNNENKICEEVTYPRIRTVLTGKRLDGSNYSSGLLNSNLKYFKVDWTPRKPDNYLLSNVLMMHIKEMIELQNFIEIDNKKTVLILNKDDVKKYLLDKDIYSNIEKIWINQNIVLNSVEMKLLKQKDFKYVPKEFFGDELKEVAE